jgi:hypothetical protein
MYRQPDHAANAGVSDKADLVGSRVDPVDVTPAIGGIQIALEPHRSADLGE